MKTLATLLFLLAHTWAAQATLEMKEEATVAVGRILLGDLAEIEGDPTLVKQLEALPVGRIELPGRETRISVQAIKNFYLRSVCPLESLTVEGEGYVMVRSRATYVSRDSLEQLLLEALLLRTEGKYEEDWELDASKLPKEIQVPEGRFGWRLEIPARYDGKGQDVATLRIEVGGKDLMRYTLPFSVRRWANVVKAVANIQRGQKVTKELIAQERVEVTHQQRPCITVLDDAIGRVALRTISRDQNMIDSWLEKPWVVKEGDEIRMNVEFGGAMVSVVGIAKQNGYKGQRIEVENTQTGKRMQAEVDGPGDVRVLN